MNCFGTVGVDVHTPYLKVVAQRGIHVVCADSHRLPFRDNVFQKVYSLGLLSAVNNREAVLAEVYRVLDFEGRFIVAATNYYGMIRALLPTGTWRILNSLKAAYNFIRGRYMAYDSRTLSKQLARAGFKPLFCRTSSLKHREGEGASYVLCICEKPRRNRG